MKYLWELIRRESVGSRREIVVAAGVSGLANAAIVAIIGAASQAAGYQQFNLRYLTLFIIAMTLYVMCQRYSAIRMVRITTRLGQTLRVRVVEKVLASEMPVLERIGTSRIVNSLSRDATTISDSGEAMIDGLQAVIFVSFAYLYILWLSLPAFVLSVLSAILAITIVMRNQSLTQALLARTRAREVEFLNNVSDAIDGFKESRLNSRRREDLQKDVYATSQKVTALREEILDVHTRSTILGRSALYMLVAMVVFLLPAVVQTYSKVISETVTAILFVVGPLGLLVGIVPYLERANEAARAIGELEQQLDAEHATAPPAAANGTTAPAKPQAITLDEARFAYRAGDGDMFVLGPVSLEIPIGKIVFLTGGNGSGKSTLLKLITGLYVPTSGRLLTGDAPVTSENIQSYRETFSAIFSDFHLFVGFCRMLGTSKAVTDWLQQMQLAHRCSSPAIGFRTSSLDRPAQRHALASRAARKRPILVFGSSRPSGSEFRRFLYETAARVEGRQRTDGATHDVATSTSPTRSSLEYGKVYVGPYERHG